MIIIGTIEKKGVPDLKIKRVKCTFMCTDECQDLDCLTNTDLRSRHRFCLRISPSRSAASAPLTNSVDVIAMWITLELKRTGSGPRHSRGVHDRL